MKNIEVSAAEEGKTLRKCYSLWNSSAVKITTSRKPDANT